MNRLKRGGAIALASVAMTGCGNGSVGSVGSLNPFSWFSGGPSESVRQETAEDRTALAAERVERRLSEPSINPELVRMPRIIEARLDYTPRGAIVRATAQSDVGGYHSALLYPVIGVRPDTTGFVTYAFMAIPPTGGRTGPNSISAGAFIPNQWLFNLNAITIAGAQDERVIRIR